VVSPKVLCRLACLLFAVVLLTGCLTLESTVRLNDDGSGRLSLVYSVSEQLYDYGVFDEESTHRIFPLSRREFELSAIAADGVRLSGYDSSRRDGVVTIEADLEFETLEGLAGLLNVPPETLASGGGGSVLRLPLFSGFEGAVDTEMVEEFWNEVRFVHRVAVPGQIRSVNLGEISENGREAVVDIRLIELMEVGGPVVWEVAW
jgi:hypothetical protein